MGVIKSKYNCYKKPKPNVVSRWAPKEITTDSTSGNELQPQDVDTGITPQQSRVLNMFKVESIPFKDMKGFLQENFIDKLLAYLRDPTTTTSVCTNSQFMQCYEVVLHHCNLEDNKHVMDILTDLVRQYINSDVKDLLIGVTGVQLLTNLAKVWDTLVIYASSMQRLFNYLNNNYLKNAARPQVPEHILNIFRREVFEKVKLDVSAAILEQINKDRNQHEVPKEAVKKSIQVLAELGMDSP